ncbi:MAG: lysophospholipid acyltransferase family protein [Bacillota bacterium]|nr:lysophospholipid acyltransferase family protein [Bacillota bacterium]
MIRTFLWFLTIVLALITSIPFWLIELIIPNKKVLPEFLLNFWIPIILAVAGVKVERTGEENLQNGPALYVGNHQGLFDMVVTLIYLGGTKGYLAKIETSKIPMLSTWMKQLNCVFIDRGNPRKALQAINECADNLKAGNSMIIFPEGTRSRNHEMNEFKPGAFKCAIKAGVPIVPFVLDGSYKAWEENHKITPTTITLKILKPIDTANMEKTKDISAVVEEEIKKALG